MVVQMKDVAERAGVSPSTVSFVFNNQRSRAISPETRKRVWVAAQKLGRLGFRILEKMRRPSKTSSSTQQVDTHLVIRKSTGAPGVRFLPTSAI